MTDREKVISGMECCYGGGVAGLWRPVCSGCPYEVSCSELETDALRLLKEQHRQIEQLKHELGVTRAAMNRCMDRDWLTKEEARTLKHMGISASHAAKGEEKRE